MLFEGSGVFADRLSAAGERFRSLPEAMRMIGFVRADGERELCHPGLRHGR